MKTVGLRHTLTCKEQLCAAEGRLPGVASRLGAA